MQPHDMHMTVQTQWMHDQLVARDGEGNIYSGGLLSDVTYKFFANGYLLSTSMYHDDLRRWIPIQLTWLRGLSEAHYAVHCKTLMEQMLHLPPPDCETLVRQVVEFLMAQKNGFISAYMNVFKEEDRAVALSKLQGCHEHFRAQVTRVKRNRTIIPAEKEVCLCFLVFFFLGPIRLRDSQRFYFVELIGLVWNWSTELNYSLTSC